MGKSFYKYLNSEDKDYVKKIDNHEILGASQQIKIISQILINVVEENKMLGTNELIKIIDDIKKYYLESRGNASRAFVNSIRELLKGIDENILDYNQLRTSLNDNVENYSKNTEINMNKILEHSNNELSVFKNFFVFDYSSTVEKVLKDLTKNTERNINLYISESSAIDGGRPYLNLSERPNINTYFFPDAASYYYLRRSECCLMGAETFYPDGTGFNTIGSDAIGHLCDLTNTKLYFITPMNKLDERRNYGIRKEKVNLDYMEKYKNNSSISTKINTSIPELIGVSPKNIYAFITEYGVIPTENMYLISRDYLKDLGG